MDKALEFLKNNIISETTVVVGVSGGPDSMALLNLILELKNQYNLSIICAHVNHNSGRKGQIDDQHFVEKYCKDKEIVCEVLKIEKYEHKNFHDEAHVKRYEFFEKLIEKYNAKYLLTAHHGDDLTETILMRLVRGTTLKGYAGFNQKIEKGNYTLLRPLISATKEEIVKYNEDRGIKFVIDTSNNKDVYTRNRFRKYILPILKEENSNVHSKFLNFSNIIFECSNYIEKQAKEVMNKVYVDRTLNIKMFKNQEKIIQNMMLNYIFEDIYKENLSIITNRHIELIYNVIECEKANTYVNLPKNNIAIKEYNNLIFKSFVDTNINYEYELNKNILLPNNRTIQFIKDTDDNSNNICKLDSKEIKLPLKVRNRLSGDTISVKGMTGHKKINDIFINSKVVSSERQIWPIVVDSNGIIVWIPGLKKSKLDKSKQEKYDIILKYC